MQLKVLCHLSIAFGRDEEFVQVIRLRSCMFCIARLCYLFLISKDFCLDHGVECGGLILFFLVCLRVLWMRKR